MLTTSFEKVNLFVHFCTIFMGSSKKKLPQDLTPLILILFTA